MKDKQMKLWITMLVLVLMFVGAGVSYAVKNTSFYRGLESAIDQTSASAQASVLLAGEPDIGYIMNIAKEDKAEKLIDSKVWENAQKYMPPAAPKSVTVDQTSCPSGSMPIVKDSKIVGCTGDEKKVKITNSALFAEETIQEAKIIKSAPVAQPTTKISCESRGKFTYTGPDMPGVLYGMCIDCLTTDFLANGRSCITKNKK